MGGRGGEGWRDGEGRIEGEGRKGFKCVILCREEGKDDWSERRREGGRKVEEGEGEEGSYIVSV